MENNVPTNKLEEAIVSTIVFFDLFDYPLTTYELWQYVGCPASLAEVAAALTQPLKGVEEKQGLYFLSGRSEIILERQARYHHSAQKFALARRAIKLFRLVPFVEMIAVSNIIGSHNLRSGSDIDLFVIAAPHRLWLTRFCCAGLAKLLGWRPTPQVKRNRICLSFYASAGALDLSGLKLGADDIYFNYWLAGLVPLYDRHQIYPELIRHNPWLKECLPNWHQSDLSPRLSLRPRRNWLNIFNNTLDRWEKRSWSWQLKIMPAALKSLINVDTRVRADEEIIKLYLVDRRAEFLAKWRERTAQLLNK